MFHRCGSVAVPQAEGPLQSYAGRLMEQSDTATKYARYTHFNDVRCPWGGLAVEKETGKCGSNFCKTTVSPHPLSLYPSNPLSLPFLSAACRPMCFVHSFISDAVITYIAMGISTSGCHLNRHD